MPSNRSVLTCNPALPGGRFFCPPLCWRATRDSNGSRRAYLTSAPAALSPPSAGLAEGLATPGFALDFAAPLVACVAAFAAGCADLAPPAAGACASTQRSEEHTAE